MLPEHVDLLDIAGIDHSTFNATEEVTLFRADLKPYARVFRRGSIVVYRAGEEVWDGEPDRTTH